MITDKHSLLELHIDNQEIPVWVYGDSKKPPIVFVHGYFNPFSEYIGDLPMRYLSRDYCMVAFDLPMFGKSKSLKISNEELIDEIWKQFLKKKSFVMFGTSYGGAISLNYALEHPERVKKLIIAGTPYFGSKTNLVKFVKWLPKKLDSKLIRLLNTFIRINPLFLKQLKIPVLLYYGTTDRNATLKMGENLSSFIPTSKLIKAKNRTHKWLLHRVDETGFLKEVKEFLEENAKAK